MKYAVIIKKTTSNWVPGDERSRTNPGHGYPEGFETTTTTEFKEFASQDELKRWVKSHTGSDYRVIEFQELEVKKEVVVDFKRPAATRSS